ncbi:ribosomal-protein-alanine N-acetyltransferase [Pseudarthrobacter sp. W1I19]|uniref:GNAT family N-acetyltransferase n=1 Tax=Pseudarthrobacter sp. W1I19 TaxID=3042288 RepID=UPI002782A181|nr:GNAT family N-acetyltransferase [Pseudarthrobacter sp. W1I19]MDQ0923652.1 ribosomal-protein-alanine N-acetyltransferase [Pseudarthrobacter sp. W1I19]
MPRSLDVSLADVDETVLEQLLELAKRDASPDEVAPPLGGPGWNLERTAWFFSYHRAAAQGLDGEAGEKTWVILAGGSPAGSIRLKRVATGNGRKSAETGIWLGRSFRSRGIGSAALRLVLAEARRAGLAEVTARTLAGNIGAQRLLTAAGAVLTYDDAGTVHAVVVL